MAGVKRLESVVVIIIVGMMIIIMIIIIMMIIMVMLPPRKRNKIVVTKLNWREGVGVEICEGIGFICNDNTSYGLY